MPKERISVFTAICLLVVAAVLWGLQLVTEVTIFVPALIGIFADILFWLWFHLLGVKYTGKKAGSNMLPMIVASIIEVVPLFDAIPALIVSVAIVIIRTRKDDADRRRAAPPPNDVNASQLIIREQQRRIAAANDNAQTEEQGESEAA